MFRGIIPAMITPMKDDLINVEATKKHIDFLIDAKIHGLFILGTNGEFHVLSNDEKVEFAELVINYVNERVPVYVGVGSCGTKETLDLAKRIEKLSPTALTIISPYLIKLTQNELEEHFRKIANNVNLPIILYNIPANTGVNIEPQTLGNLKDCRNILGIKDSSGNMDNLKCYVDTMKDQKDFSVLVGSDSKILEAMKLGAHGAVASTANAIPNHIVMLYNKFCLNENSIANKLQKDIDEIRVVCRRASVPAVIKRIVTVMGNSVGEARMPVEQIGSKLDADIVKMLEFYQKV